MIFPARVRLLGLVLIAALVSCRATAPVPTVVMPPPELPVPSTSAQWRATQALVLTLVADNRVGSADSTLQQFASDFVRTPEGDRARWWRTLMRSDPRATGGEVTATVALIDSLLSDSVITEVRSEALLMRRTIVAIDSIRRGELRRRVQATQLASDRLDELKTARDSMAKLNAEIDRLRRRLRP